MSHGTFAVPAPATARLVQGVPVYGAGDGELLTPTGALLVTGHAEGVRPAAPPSPAGDRARRGLARHARPTQRAAADRGRSGFGRGGRDGARPGDRSRRHAAPQLLGALLDRLLAAGALDVYYTPDPDEEGTSGDTGHGAQPARAAGGAGGDPVRGDHDARRAAPGVGAQRARPRRGAGGDRLRRGAGQGGTAGREGLQRAARVRGLPAGGGGRRRPRQGGVERGPRAPIGGSREPPPRSSSRHRSTTSTTCRTWATPTPRSPPTRSPARAACAGKTRSS